MTFKYFHAILYYLEDGEVKKIEINNDYDGYGEFAGLDLFEIIASMNGREAPEGFNMFFDEQGKVIFPMFLEEDREVTIEELKENKTLISADNQVFFE